MTAPISNEPTTHGYTTMRDATIRPRWANFFAHRTQPRDNCETTITTARPQQGTSETGVAFARAGSAPTETVIAFAGEK